MLTVRAAVAVRVDVGEDALVLAEDVRDELLEVALVVVGLVVRRDVRVDAADKEQGCL